MADVIGSALRELGQSIRVIPMGDAEDQDVRDCDVFGIGSPCFSSKAPTPVKKFLSDLPCMENKRAFIFATCGGAPGRLLHDLGSPLQEKGATVLGKFLCRGEVHHPAPVLHGRFPGRPDERDFRRARRFIHGLVNDELNCLDASMSDSEDSRIIPEFGFYDLVARISTDSVLRRFLPEPQIDHALCDCCGWCADACSMLNISMNPYPEIGFKCIRCYRCSTGCPQDAMAVDWTRGNLLLWLLYNTTFIRRFGDVRLGEQIY
ncbi:MAG: hypothetical protein GTO18_07730 [Anaerolineales bacterium]|nr:hypothetical protein [Anaerolineales bacterium]